MLSLEAQSGQIRNKETLELWLNIFSPQRSMSEKSFSNNFVRVAISSKMELPQLPLIQTNMFNAIIFGSVYRIWKKKQQHWKLSNLFLRTTMRVMWRKMAAMCRCRNQLPDKTLPQHSTAPQIIRSQSWTKLQLLSRKLIAFVLSTLVQPLFMVFTPWNRLECALAIQ